MKWLSIGETSPNRKIGGMMITAPDMSEASLNAQLICWGRMNLAVYGEMKIKIEPAVKLILKKLGIFSRMIFAP